MGTRPPRLPHASPVRVVASPSLLLPFCTATPARASQGGVLEAGICIACFVNMIMASGFCVRQVYGCMTTTMCVNSPNTTSTRNGWSVDYWHHNLFKVKLYSKSRLPTVKMSTESSRESHSTSNKRGGSCTKHDSRIAVNASKVLKNDPVDKKGISETVSHMVLKQWQTLQFMTAAGLVACILLVPSADAADALKTYACLLNECRLELVKCISNPSCAANIACLETCNDRPDESECEIKCGDLFENKVVDEFNQCVVSRKKCVTQKSDVGDFPIPDPSTVVKSFDISDFTGKWYITSGLNPAFDIFDCQEHDFHVESEKLVGSLTWRIRTPDTGFFTRYAIQKFVQDPLQPGILYNHDNEYLHYQDDWYIISSKIENTRDDYIFVYYRGRNDAWDGYGGVVVYTRSAVLPKTIVPELERAAKSIGRDFSKFVTTDNTCGPEPPLVERIKKTVDRWIWSTR